MNTVSYVKQECPTCGRPLRVQKRWLHETVVCRHCKARFEAGATHQRVQVHRADKLLEAVRTSHGGSLASGRRTAGLPEAVGKC